MCHRGWFDARSRVIWCPTAVDLMLESCSMGHKTDRCGASNRLLRSIKSTAAEHQIDSCGASNRQLSCIKSKALVHQIKLRRTSHRLNGHGHSCDHVTFFLEKQIKAFCKYIVINILQANASILFTSAGIWSQLWPWPFFMLIPKENILSDVIFELFERHVQLVRMILY